MFTLRANNCNLRGNLKLLLPNFKVPNVKIFMLSSDSMYYPVNVCERKSRFGLNAIIENVLYNNPSYSRILIGSRL